MDEFAAIARYFLPLTRGEDAALRLQDDAAIITPPAGYDLVITSDMLHEGVHFFAGTDPALVAQKALRVNLSDLAAMGADPYAYNLCVGLPPHADESFIAAIARGLGDDQARFNIFLLGGDTTRSKANFSLCITAFGLVPHGSALRRSGAQPGERIMVSGMIGRAHLGLLMLQDKLQPDATCIEAYHLPIPRLDLVTALRGSATSCMDISDGLAQDLTHILNASGCGAALWLHAIPFPEYDYPATELIAGGDDYELLFTLPDDGSAVPNGCVQIGITRAEPGLTILDAQGQEITLTKLGYQH